MQKESFLIAGVDEVGRGPLAGPVVAAAVILDPSRRIDGLLDSKMLDETTREELNVLIRRHALAWSIAEASVEEIDTINILHASMLAMSRAVAGLAIKPDLALIDGNRCPQVDCPSQAVVKGDQRVQAISAASIIAKVSRDNFMQRLHDDHPQYGFASHKGYPTVQHRQAILEHGVMHLHRRTFKPVREALQLAHVKAVPVDRTDVTGTHIDGIPVMGPDVCEKQDNETQPHAHKANKAQGSGTQTQPGSTTVIV